MKLFNLEVDKFWLILGSKDSGESDFSKITCIFEKVIIFNSTVDKFWRKSLPRKLLFVSSHFNLFFPGEVKAAKFDCMNLLTFYLFF